MDKMMDVWMDKWMECMFQKAVTTGPGSLLVSYGIKPFADTQLY